MAKSIEPPAIYRGRSNLVPTTLELASLLAFRTVTDPQRVAYHEPITLVRPGMAPDPFVPDVSIRLPNGTTLAILVQYSEYQRTSHIPFFKKLNDYINIVLWANPRVIAGFFLAGPRDGWKPGNLDGFAAYGNSFGDALRDDARWAEERSALLETARVVGLPRGVFHENSVTAAFMEEVARSHGLRVFMETMKSAAKECLSLQASVLDAGALDVLSKRVESVSGSAHKLRAVHAANWFPPLAAFHLTDGEALTQQRIFSSHAIVRVTGKDAKLLSQLSQRPVLGIGRGTYRTANRFVSVMPAGPDLIAAETALGLQLREAHALPSEIRQRVPHFAVGALRRDKVEEVLRRGATVFAEGLEYLKARLGVSTSFVQAMRQRPSELARLVVEEGHDGPEAFRVTDQWALQYVVFVDPDGSMQVAARRYEAQILARLARSYPGEERALLRRFANVVTGSGLAFQPQDGLVEIVKAIVNENRQYDTGDSALVRRLYEQRFKKQVAGGQKQAQDMQPFMDEISARGIAAGAPWTIRRFTQPLRLPGPNTIDRCEQMTHLAEGPKGVVLISARGKVDLGGSNAGYLSALLALSQLEANAGERAIGGKRVSGVIFVAGRVDDYAVELLRKAGVFAVYSSSTGIGMLTELLTRLTA